jgi:hypothetical protein
MIVTYLLLIPIFAEFASSCVDRGALNGVYRMDASSPYLRHPQVLSASLSVSGATRILSNFSSMAFFTPEEKHEFGDWCIYFDFVTP